MTTMLYNACFLSNNIDPLVLFHSPGKTQSPQNALNCFLILKKLYIKFTRVNLNSLKNEMFKCFGSPNKNRLSHRNHQIFFSSSK